MPDLERIVGSKGLQKVSAARNAVGYLLPFLDRYDAMGEAEQALKELKEIDPRAAAGIQQGELAALLNELYETKYKGMMYASRFADTADRLTSLVGGIAEAFGVLAGGLPGVAASIGEDTVEMILKIPAYAFLAANPNGRRKIPQLIGIEALTYTPVIGDIYDSLTNLYIRTTKELIREEAIDGILNGYRESKST